MSAHTLSPELLQKWQKIALLQKLPLILTAPLNYHIYVLEINIHLETDIKDENGNYHIAFEGEREKKKTKIFEETASISVIKELSNTSCN